MIILILKINKRQAKAIKLIYNIKLSLLLTLYSCFVNGYCTYEYLAVDINKIKFLNKNNHIFVIIQANMITEKELRKKIIGKNETIKGIITDQEVEKLRNGVEIEDYITKPAKVKILKIDEEKNISRLAITIHEGKNRQVRKMCEAIGKKVQALHRSKIGNIDVKDVKIK